MVWNEHQPYDYKLATYVYSVLMQSHLTDITDMYKLMNNL